MNTGYVSRHGLDVNLLFADFVERDLVSQLPFSECEFWEKLASIISTFSSENEAHLEIREDLQAKINLWCKDNRNNQINYNKYKDFLEKIGYLEPLASPFEIETNNVDSEIALIAAPQLVVPLSNARFALNASNARWGSLFDALYGSNVIPNKNSTQAKNNYNPQRGEAVIDYALNFLDKVIPLKNARHAEVDRYVIDHSHEENELYVNLIDGSKSKLKNCQQFIGWSEEKNSQSLLFKNNNLHIELKINPNDLIGKDAPGNICDIFLESAVTTIMDCEDSVAAVDSEDKVNVYRNWLGLMLGTLTCEMQKSGKQLKRSLNKDKIFTAKNGKLLSLSGRALMLVRNVGQHMKTDMILDSNKNLVSEGFVDAFITTACALAGNKDTKKFFNSKTESIYIVKPKIHGSHEAKLFNRLLMKLEELFELPENMIKVGLMDEERRTSCNLMQCIKEIKHRIVFINTGFLDRTGDEIHTSMHLGPMCEKEKIKQQDWLDAYEKQNVDIGITCGFIGKAQIGKGMWAKPDELKEMMEVKIEHLKSGANCAWVPSPTAATLHALHYHCINVKAVQQEIKIRCDDYVLNLLKPPVSFLKDLTSSNIQDELDNNIQGILGYVVHWVNQGVGCSKVLDIDNVYLMEDRATLRISSQHIANWLLHKVCTKEQVLNSFYKMAEYVDEQNLNINSYTRLLEKKQKSYAFQAACELVFQGCNRANGYTEEVLHKYRILEKNQKRKNKTVMLSRLLVN